MAKRENIAYNRINIVLAEKNVSKKDLAEKIGKSVTMVSYYCSNTSQPSLQTLHQIALALKVDVRRLIVPTPDEDEK
ncbi:helix-turn-helix transcriptional regulator [Fluviicola sp.]|uniref:helix-turn-helix domain-containing protein n=1 Tax=Fluviicola sp. TaxID=1917219 RepID=UPI002626E7AC|nr:helix-turn-helix transcriptional regulator [Fluviicola sp.]